MNLPREVLLVLLAVGLGIIESSVPRPLPFLRIGLANVVTVAAIWKYGLGSGITINTVRACGTAVYLGTLATPTFIMSITGGLASALVMGLLKGRLSVTGMSVSGSSASLLVQLAVATLLLPGLPFSGLLPMVLLWGTASGIATGAVAVLLLRRGFPWIGCRGVDSSCMPA